MNKLFNTLLFIVFGLGVPWYLSAQLNWAKRSLEHHVLFGLFTVFAVSFAMMTIFILAHQYYYRCQPREEYSKMFMVAALLSFILPNTTF